MEGIFNLNEDTYVHGIWSYGAIGFDCMGMLFRQGKGPWTARWRFRRHLDDKIEESEDEKSVYAIEGTEGSDEERDDMWAMCLAAAKGSAAKVNELTPHIAPIEIEHAVVSGGAMAAIEALRKMRCLAVSETFEQDGSPIVASTVGEA
jgi:hypothetical protein